MRLEFQGAGWPATEYGHRPAPNRLVFFRNWGSSRRMKCGVGQMDAHRPERKPEPPTCHHVTWEYLRAYIRAAGFEPRAKVPLFQSASGRKPALSGKPMTGGKVWDAVKRRCKEAGLPSSISNHSFRATSITIHQEYKGRLEDAQALAGHADARTTRLYIRAERKLAQAEVERVQL